MKITGHQPISVVISVYQEDNPQHFKSSMESVVSEQTIRPDEVIVVADGPLTPELNQVIDSFDGVITYRLPKNEGAGAARSKGVQEASYELIAFQDADDISVPHRFEKQIQHFETDSDLDALGGYISEFETDPEEPHTVREVPTHPEKVSQWAKFRSPLNQTTVMAKRSSILSAGNYHNDERMEDYGLWARMLVNGMRLANLPMVLAKVRAGSDEMASRRGGLKYAREEMRMQREFYEMGFVTAPIAILNVIVRIPTRLMPNRLRSFVYQYILRS